MVDRLREKNIVVMQEVREGGALSGGIINSYVIFEPPVEAVYRLLSQSARQVEFRPEADRKNEPAPPPVFGLVSRSRSLGDESTEPTPDHFRGLSGDVSERYF